MDEVKGLRFREVTFMIVISRPLFLLVEPYSISQHPLVAYVDILAKRWRGEAAEEKGI